MNGIYKMLCWVRYAFIYECQNTHAHTHILILRVHVSMWQDFTNYEHYDCSVLKSLLHVTENCGS